MRAQRESRLRRWRCRFLRRAILWLRRSFRKRAMACSAETSRWRVAVSFPCSGTLVSARKRSICREIPLRSVESMRMTTPLRTWCFFGIDDAPRSNIPIGNFLDFVEEEESPCERLDRYSSKKSFQHFVDSRGREGAKVIVVEIEVTVFSAIASNCKKSVTGLAGYRDERPGGLRFAWFGRA